MKHDGAFHHFIYRYHYTVLSRIGKNIQAAVSNGERQACYHIRVEVGNKNILASGRGKVDATERSSAIMDVSCYKQFSKTIYHNTVALLANRSTGGVHPLHYPGGRIFCNEYSARRIIVHGAVEG